MIDELDICPDCLRNVCNGMGSSQMPITTWILNKFPMAELFKRSFKIHDMSHHRQIGFKLSNTLLVRHMKAELKLIKFSGWYFVRASKRNWYRVVIIPRIMWFISGKSGREAYDKGKCKKLPRKYTGELSVNN